MESKPPAQETLARAEGLIAQGRSDAALELLQDTASSGPEEARRLNAAGRALNNLGRLAEAEAALRRAVEIDPADARARANLGHVRARLGDARGAEESWRGSLGIDPDQPRALRGLAQLLARSRRLPEAVSLLERVVERAPDDADNWLNLAEIYQFLEEPAKAAAAFEAAIARAPGRVEAHAGLARLLFSAGAIRRAAGAYRDALALAPDSPDLASGLAVCLDVLGERSEGLAVLGPWLESAPASPAVDYAAGRLLFGEGDSAPALARLERAAASDDPAWQGNSALWYWLGKVRETAGRYEAAFDAWTRANALKPARFDAAGFRRRVEAIAAAPPAPPMTGGEDADPRPVFIVGMPRSGTTLVEQILSCHPRVQAGGERLELEHAANRLWADGERVVPADDREVERLRRSWLSAYGPLATGVTRFTDKYPGNFMHLGLAARLWPNAFVIWCRRDRGDTALSIYANDFNRNLVPWATRLEHIAAAWNAQLRLMRRWRDRAGLALHEVGYETLIDDLEGQVRRLLTFLDLDWEPGCLRFHESERFANTASFDAVRRPVYRSSIGRHRPFSARLGPFFEGIAVHDGS